MNDCAPGRRIVRLFGRELLLVTSGQGKRQLIGCDEGAVVDQTSGFYATGLIEKMIENIDESFDVLFIKGQASVYHPTFGGLAASILYGSQPDAIIFVHDPNRTHRYHWEHLPIKDIKEEIRTLEEMTGASVVGIATRGSENIDKLKLLVSLPVADPLLGDGTEVLLSATWSQLDLEIGNAVLDVANR